jgi:hypothetical protein
MHLETIQMFGERRYFYLQEPSVDKLDTEDGGSICIRNVGDIIHTYMA